MDIQQIQLEKDLLRIGLDIDGNITEYVSNKNVKQYVNNFFEFIKDGNIEVIKFALSLEVDEVINKIENDEFKLPLMFALEHKQDDIAKLLIESGANINCTSNFKTPLHIAIERNDYMLTKYLLEKGADQNYYSSKRWMPPIHLACQQKLNRLHIVELLLEYGADPSCWDENDKTAFDYVEEDRMFIHLFSKYNHIKPNEKILFKLD